MLHTCLLHAHLVMSVRHDLFTSVACYLQRLMFSCQCQQTETGTGKQRDRGLIIEQDITWREGAGSDGAGLNNVRGVSTGCRWLGILASLWFLLSMSRYVVNDSSRTT